MRPAGRTILVWGLVWSQAVMAANLVVNPGFEEGTKGWVGFSCTVSTSTMQQVDDCGTRYARVAGPGCSVTVSSWRATSSTGTGTGC